MISALAWVPRGAAKPVVEEALGSDEELADIEVRIEDSHKVVVLLRLQVTSIVLHSRKAEFRKGPTA